MKYQNSENCSRVKAHPETRLTTPKKTVSISTNAAVPQDTDLTSAMGLLHVRRGCSLPQCLLFEKVVPFLEELVTADFAARVGLLEDIERRRPGRCALAATATTGLGEQVPQQGGEQQQGNQQDQDHPQAAEQHAEASIEHPAVVVGSVHGVLDSVSRGWGIGPDRHGLWPQRPGSPVNYS